LANFNSRKKIKNNSDALMIPYIHVLKGINNDWIAILNAKVNILAMA